MAYDFTLTTELPASPRTVFEAWLSSEGHTAMTGGVATATTAPGGAFDAWDGYISGHNVELEPYRRIVQTWRTANFADTDPDSTIEVLLEETGSGTRLTLNHRDVPDGQTSYEQGGWESHYFAPMKKRFEWLKMNPSDTG